MDENKPLKQAPTKRKGTKTKTTTVSKPLHASAFCSRMPTGEKIQRILHERALQLASTVKEEEGIVREDFVCIRLGLSGYYGVAFAYLENITKFDFISPIPCTPPVIAGVVNYRGILLTILDLKQLFRTDTSEASKGNMVVVVRFNNFRVGFLVDEVEGSDEFMVAELQPPMHTGGVSNLNYVQGIHQGRVTILNVQAILTDPLLQVEENVI